MSTQRDVVTVSEIVFGNSFENKNGITVQPVNINIVERLNQFKKNDDDEKEEKEIRQLTINLSEFTRILVLNDYLALIKDSKVPEEITERKLQLAKQYEDQLRVLKGAKITIEREKIEEPEFDLSKPLEDKDGNPIMKDGEQVYDVKVDDEGKPIKKLVGYGDTRFTKLELSAAAAKLAEHLAFNK